VDLAIDQAGTRDRRLLAGGWAGVGLLPVTHIAQQAELLRRRRYGRIVTQQGRLRAIYGRWWPHLGNLMQVCWDMNFRNVAPDRCELFYHQPLASPGFLTLSYVHSGYATSMATLYAAGLVLDEVARLRGADAIVSQITNARISDRVLQRWGWEKHCHDWPGRHFIKRFYGNYPSIDPRWQQRITSG
jgi:hypothetical protein